jgi:hypothetical protein
LIDSPSYRNVDDWRQRYNKTYGWFRPEAGEKKLVYITDVNQKVVFHTSDGQEFFANLDKDVKFEFLPITRGWFYTRDGGAVLLQRVPAKQYHRGISKNNTAMYFLRADGTLGGRGLGAGLEFTVLEDVFVSQPTPHFQEFLKGKSWCWLPSKFFAVCFHGQVYMYDTRIGTFDRVKNIITLDNTLFLQELRDAIRRCGVQMEVVCNENLG